MKISRFTSLKSFQFLLGSAIFILLIEYLHGSIFSGPELISKYYMQILMFAGINVIMTVGLNLVNGFTGQFSIGHAGFMAIGAYTSAVFTTILFRGTELSYPFQLLLLIAGSFAGGLFAALVGYLLALPSFRLRGDYLAIVTLAFGEVVRSIIRASDEISQFFSGLGLEPLAFIFEQLSGPRGLGGIPGLTSFPLVYIFTVITVLFIRNFIYSTHGRACLSIREDEIAAETMGIDTTKYKILAFVISAFFAGIAGGLYAHVLKFLHPDNFSFVKSIDYLIYLYAGGMGSISGSIVAATSLTLLPEVMRVIGLQQWRLVIYPLLLIILMLRRPEGLFGIKELKLIVPKEREIRLNGSA